MDISIEKILTGNAHNRCLSTYGPWTTMSLAHTLETISVERSGNPPLGISFFFTDSCSSTMDLAWRLIENNIFPEWSSVLSLGQHHGRGQFRRAWISDGGNLYATMRLPNHLSCSAMTPMMLAMAVHITLRDLGIYSEFKWPNDILVSRRKVGGILVEKRDDNVIAGFGVNLFTSPSMDELNDPRALPPGHLGELGLSVSPLEIWPRMVQAVMDCMTSLSQGTQPADLLKVLENSLAFMGETVVFKPHSAEEFQAVIQGLTETGGIRLKTVNGERTCHNGSLIPVVY
ncbi:MAG: biotin--[acetyl-CoA-carboxylase] ligase [Proteobacteria bacterium]|nr:biotin--[acetyl-CoA-carboxylase] ligase [Pseudomonadota bacterium]